MKDVLVVATPNAAGHASKFAFALAQLTEAHVTALITEIEPDFGMIEPDLRQDEDKIAEQRSTKERLARTIDLIQDAARRAKVTCTVMAECRSSALRERLIDSAQ